MPTRCLPREPNLEQLRTLAKTLQRLVRSGDPGAVELVREFHPRLGDAVPGSSGMTGLSRADVQLALARSYGFASWPRLRDHVVRVNRLTRNPHRQPVGNPVGDGAGLVDEFLRLACLNYGADDPSRPARARALLGEHPELAAATIHTAAAVGNVEAVRQLLAADASMASREGGPYDWEPLLYLAYSRVDSADPAHSTLEVARLLLDAGADPNAGYLWESEYPFTALTGAFGEGENGANTPPHQHALALARLLLEAGADPNDSQTLYNRQWSPNDDHLELLVGFGLGRGTATVWQANLGAAHPTPQELVEALQAACLRADRSEVERLVAGDPTLPDELVEACPDLLGKAAKLGRIDAIRALVAVGFDLNPADRRTPLHEAAFHGDLALVRALVELGADPAVRDPHFDSTPAGWADHNRRHDVVRYLAALEQQPS